MRALVRPNGYFRTLDPSTLSWVEGETRSCVHCGFMWIYDPGAHFKRTLGLEVSEPTARGTCLKCHGLVCARVECLQNGCKSVEQQLEELERSSNLLLVT